MYKWTVLLSRTGSELVTIEKILHIFPDVVITDDRDKLCEDVLLNISKYKSHLCCIEKKDYKSIETYTQNSHIVTLHGYMRIIPVEFITDNMYNGHPGLIDVFPELKGRDPQERAYKLKHQLIGSVIHRVTGEVDSGEIVASFSTQIHQDSTLEDYIEVLRFCSIQTWINFLKKII